jgi:hypothetical protein
MDVPQKMMSTASFHCFHFFGSHLRPCGLDPTAIGRSAHVALALLDVVGSSSGNPEEKNVAFELVFMKPEAHPTKWLRIRLIIHVYMR